MCARSFTGLSILCCTLLIICVLHIAHSRTSKDFFNILLSYFVSHYCMFIVKDVLKYQPRGLFDITKDCIGVYLEYIHIYLHYFIFIFCCPNCETVNIDTKICMLLFCKMPFFIP